VQKKRALSLVLTFAGDAEFQHGVQLFSSKAMPDHSQFLTPVTISISAGKLISLFGKYSLIAC
jgi:hypothetical protein